MAPLNSLKIHEITKVTPSSDSTTDCSLPLTFFDTFWFKFPPVERLFFYQIPHLSPHFFNSVILPKLKQSLSHTLLHFLPLAGNLMWPSDAPKPSIYYSPNDGVSLTVAVSNADFNYLSGNGFREATEYHPLIPQLSVSDDKTAIIAIQITLFVNEGFCIGMTGHHSILDGKSSTMFIKSWAYICKQDNQDPSLLPEFTPFLDRSVIKDPTGLDMVYLNNWLSFTGSDSHSNPRSLNLLPSISIGVDSNLVRATYELTREDIKKVRNKILSKVAQSEQLHLSTFVLTCAYVFVCIVKAKRKEEGNAKLVFGFTADYRSRLDPPIPTNYFGNCVGSHALVAEANDLMEEDGVLFFAEKLSKLIKRLERGSALEGMAEKLAGFMEMMKQGVKAIGIAGSPRFDNYGSDFGWGRPKKVEIVSIDRSGAIALAESRDGSGGMEVGIVLEKQEMEVFASVFVDGLKHLHLL